MADTSDRFDPFQYSYGVTYGFFGIPMLVAGGLMLLNRHQAHELLGVGGLLLVGCGLYLTIAGAVARGIQMSRR